MDNQEQPVETKTEPSKLSQKDAIYNYVMSALNNKPAEGQKLKELVDKDVRKVVRQKLFQAFKTGEIKISKQYDDSKLKKYCSGLINNWLEKDPRFN